MKMAYGMMLCLIMLSFAACTGTSSSANSTGRFLSNALNAFDTAISSASQVSSGLKTVAAGQPVVFQPVVVRHEAPQAVVSQPITTPSAATPPVAAQSVGMQSVATQSVATRIVSEESEDAPLIIPSDYTPPPSEPSNVIVIPLQPLCY